MWRLDLRRTRSRLLAWSYGLLLGPVLASSAAAQRQGDADRWRQARERLVSQSLAPAGIQDSATLAAMRTVPRHEFVPPDQRAHAYEDIPLPIGQGQTISQPAVVALMTQLIGPRAGKRVLEVGTGSGYQAAVLAEAGCRVWTIEIFGVLARQARARLARLGYDQVTVRHGDGYAGWPEEAPFEAILVTAAADSIPPALLDQLAAGGRLVMPVGHQFPYQELVLVEKDSAGRLSSRKLLPVRFVPLLRGVR
ncbi:MAG: protein-L-isoaspartate(D-aspartate) O-methyltransferase [Gemmatimonadales bacterium]